MGDDSLHGEGPDARKSNPGGVSDDVIAVSWREAFRGRRGVLVVHVVFGGRRVHHRLRVVLCLLGVYADLRHRARRSSLPTAAHVELQHASLASLIKVIELWINSLKLTKKQIHLSG